MTGGRALCGSHVPCARTRHTAGCRTSIRYLLRGSAAGRIVACFIETIKSPMFCHAGSLLYRFVKLPGKNSAWRYRLQYLYLYGMP